MILRDDHDADWTAATDATLERRVYPIQNWAQNWRADVVALLADNGRVLERTWYEPYGTPHSSPAADLTGSLDTNSDFYGVPVGVPVGVVDSVDSSQSDAL